MLRKLFFGLAAVCFMTLAMSSCSEKKLGQNASETVELTEPTGDNPLEKLTSLLQNYVDVLKATHIESEEDMQALMEQTLKLHELYEALEKEADEFSASLTEEDEKELLKTYPKIFADIEQLCKDAEKETERLEKEAEANGIDLDDDKFKLDFDDFYDDDEVDIDDIDIDDIDD